MLRRNRFGFRLRRRGWTNHLIQGLVVSTVLCTFLYIIAYAFTTPNGGDTLGPDFSWLKKTRNMTVFTQGSVLTEPSRRKKVCDKREPFRLLVAVHSAVENFERRQIIRQTWGDGFMSLSSVKLVFILGRSPQRKHQAAVEKESVDYSDIVQMDFIDSYLNLTLKTAFTLKWINSNDCVKASKFFFKVDDDSFVHPHNLWNSLEHALLYSTSTKTLQNFIPKKKSNEDEITLNVKEDVVLDNVNIKRNSLEENSHDLRAEGRETAVGLKDEEDDSTAPVVESLDYLILGHVFHGVPVRDPRNKWYLPNKFYPLNIFPRYVSGSGYVISTSLAPVLYECALRTPFINIEDVFLTGLCATTQLGLRITHSEAFRPARPSVGSDYICWYKTSALVHPITEPQEMIDLWRRVNIDDHNCDTFYFSLVQFLNKIVKFVRNLFRI